jgi:hypothetical protein
MRIIILALILTLAACAQLAPLPEPIVMQSADLSQFKYVIIPDEDKVTWASKWSLKEFSPDDYIEDLLMKRGIIRLYSVKPDNATKENTLAVNYSASGQREIMLGMGGYTVEVSISLLSAQTMSPVYTCTAEGIGSTEVDDIRVAITRCLSHAK